MNKRGLVCGVGVNDADYLMRPMVDGKWVVCPFYRTWYDMLKRCYSPVYQSRCPTYIGCSVVKEWHSFMAFREWMMSQDWQGKQLDKDMLIKGNKVYGPDICVFIDSKTNTLLIDSAAARGDLPIGVSMNCKGYQAQCSRDGKPKYLGIYDTIGQASDTYKVFKADVILEAAQRQPDIRVYQALFKRRLEILASITKP